MRQINTILVAADREVDAEQLTTAMVNASNKISVAYDGNGDVREFYETLANKLDGAANVFVAGDTVSNDLFAEIAREYGYLLIYYVPNYGETDSRRRAKRDQIAAFVQRHEHARVNHSEDVDVLAREVVRLSVRFLL